MIDANGRCCGRKPIHYKRGHTTTSGKPQYYCTRCDASYDPTTREQVDNWAWEKSAGGRFTRRKSTVTVIQ